MARKTTQKGLRLTPSEADLLKAVGIYTRIGASSFIMKAVIKEINELLPSLSEKQRTNIKRILENIDKELLG